jgi:hypothetical protein
LIIDDDDVVVVVVECGGGTSINVEVVAFAFDNPSNVKKSFLMYVRTTMVTNKNNLFLHDSFVLFPISVTEVYN